MKNEATWLPTKYRMIRGSLRAATNPADVNPGSRLVVERIASFYDRAIAEYAHGRLIDLGCGKAPLFMKYKWYVSSVTCVDWNNTIHKNDHLDMECDLTKRLPFDDGVYDTIILSDVLEHIPEPSLLWGEMYRILSINGRILMSVPYFYPLHEIPYDYYRYSCYALRRFATDHGFEVLQLDTLGGSPEVMADMVAKHLQFIPLIGSFAARFVQAITLFATRTRVGKKVSRKTSERYPLGYGMVAKKGVAGPTKIP